MNGLLNPENPVTPDAKSAPEPECATFLRNVLNRSDLAEFAWFLQRSGVQNWVFTGSIALQIHAYALNHAAGKAREPRDVDIVTDEAGKRTFENMMRHMKRTVTHVIESISATEGLSNFSFKNKFDVDIIAKNVTDGFGHISTDKKIVQGVPVLNLDALLTSKERLLSGGWERDEASKKKAEDDIVILKQLKALQDRKAEQSPQVDGQPAPAAATSAVVTATVINAAEMKRPAHRKLFDTA